MRIAVVLSERGRLALDERVGLVRAAAEVVDVLVAATPADALRRVPAGAVPYLLDVNRVTSGVAAVMAARRRPYVVDTGDDPATLARSGGHRAEAVVQATVERLVLRRAAGVVCRGSFHLPILRAKTPAPLCWAPDTVPDALVDEPRPPADPAVVASFGSAAAPHAGDRAYGWEVVDVVARVPGLRGILVVNGPGGEALRGRARRRGVSERVSVEAAMPLADLARRIESAATVTSVQSDDLAGWVRTTGKLPIALGLGKVLATTRVGEASRVLPERMLVAPGDDDAVVAAIAGIVTDGVPPGWPDDARARAEPFRRSAVSARLRSFLDAL